MSHTKHTCSHGPGAHAPGESQEPRALEQGDDGRLVKATAAPFGVAAIDENERRERIEKLKKMLEQRIVLLDGAMGTMIQREKLDEQAFRGERRHRAGPGPAT